MDMLGDPWAIASNPIGRKMSGTTGEHQTQRKCGAIRNRNSKAKDSCVWTGHLVEEGRGYFGRDCYYYSYYFFDIGDSLDCVADCNSFDIGCDDFQHAPPKIKKTNGGAIGLFEGSINN